jgi:hypothetical protein
MPTPESDAWRPIFGDDSSCSLRTTRGWTRSSGAGCTTAFTDDSRGGPSGLPIGRAGWLAAQRSAPALCECRKSQGSSRLPFRAFLEVNEQW